MTGSSAPVQAGDILAGKYRVDHVIGRGGMGVVVAAMHLQLEQRVALKFMLPEVLGNREAVERFGREARAAARLKSEHVSRIIDVGLLESGSPYIVMEYLEGTDLASILARDGRLPVTEVADYIVQALDALAEAHAVGIVHRDLKPGNVFLTRRADGSALVKVLDFGISKTGAVTADAALTRTQAVIGSPMYMSPEHMRASRMVDVRSDIWSLGVMLYELVSGRVPFAADTFSALVLQVALDPPRPLVSPLPLPDGFESVVWRCLEKDPRRRFQNVAELAAALAPFAPASVLPTVERIRNLAGRKLPPGLSPAPTQPMTRPPAVLPTRLMTDPPAPAVTTSAHTTPLSPAYTPAHTPTDPGAQTVTPWHTEPTPRKSRRTVAVVAAVVVIAAVVGTLFAVLRRDRESGEVEKAAKEAPAPTPPPGPVHGAASEPASPAAQVPAPPAPEVAPPAEAAPSAPAAVGSAPADAAPKAPPRRRANRPRRTVKPTGHPEIDDPLATPE